MNKTELSNKLRTIAAREPRCKIVETDGLALRKCADGDYEARVSFIGSDGQEGWACCFLTPTKPESNFLLEFEAVVEMATEAIDVPRSAS